LHRYGEEFERRLVEGYRGDVRVGDPLMRGVNVGPVFHKAGLSTSGPCFISCIQLTRHS
jgi:acyl-CoA reductase-like NAD-dependent aldehyde dehydrogenase